MKPPQRARACRCFTRRTSGHATTRLPGEDLQHQLPQKGEGADVVSGGFHEYAMLGLFSGRPSILHTAGLHTRDPGLPGPCKLFLAKNEYHEDDFCRMNVLKSLRLIPGGPGKRSGLGLLLSMAKQELQRTEGMLAQVQDVRSKIFYNFATKLS